MDFGDDQEGGSESNQHQQQQQNQNQRRKRYHRHTPRQIQTLEAMFKECPHPDEAQRANLSRELGLEARQIKFWFQNRRTQMKAQHERQDNCFLRQENDKIRCENIAMREALKNVICPTCGGPPIAEDYFDEQKLRMENARLKQELDSVAGLTAKYLGRPFTQLPQGTPQMNVSSLDLSMGGVPMGGVPMGGGHHQPFGGGLSLDLDLLSGAGLGMPLSDMPTMHLPAPVTEKERPDMAKMATRAMDELIRLTQQGGNVWVKIPGGDGRETIDVQEYDSIYSKPGSSNFRAGDIRVEGSRDSAIVCMSPVNLVEVFMDPSKFMEFFPSIVSHARITDPLVNGLNGRNESLVMMYEQLQFMTPAVPTREFSFLRYCRQIDQGMWAIADVSADMQREAHYGAPPPRSRRLPSGCLIADMTNGYSKVTWVEHMEIEDKSPIGPLYRDIVQSGAAFGAHRWVAALHRACERYASSLEVPGVMHGETTGVTAEGRRSMMALSQRMVSSFCGGMTASPQHQWTTMPGAAGNEVCVRVSMNQGSQPGHPNGVVLGAATSVWLPVPADHVFGFLRDENTRTQWDVLCKENSVQPVSRIPNGPNPGNCITLLRAVSSSQTPQGGQATILVLQESCTDASGCSMVVYSPIDIPAANMMMSGADPSGIPLLPSGFAIWPAGVGGGASTSAATPMAAGCIVSVAFQILISSLPSSKLNAESIATVNNLVSTTVQNIKAALNCV
ncbi:homeobox-leucine zipper protein ROC8-like [Triticum urartu]|uniref:Homeobox-leucine zipper protein ROC8 n=2 Tax=Triticum TaxID=4564 RepID=A0A8R7V1A7_TRIUA|nr:homeobox-leucine zipper protein ROC8-like [Triticum urartu]